MGEFSSLVIENKKTKTKLSLGLPYNGLTNGWLPAPGH